MKNIRFYFGYYGISKYSKFTWRLCEKLPFIPSVDLELFRTTKGGEPCPLKHSIYIGWLKYYWHWSFSTKRNKWRFDNLTGSKI